MVSVLRHVNVLHDEMDPDEVERVWIKALRVERGHQGALMLTDRNLRWSGMGGLTQSQEVFPLAKLRDVTVLPAHKGTLLRLSVAGVEYDFEAKQADLDTLLPQLEAQRAEVPLDDEVDDGPDLVEELERLTKLRMIGALTDAEFDNAKRQLLG